MESTRSFWWRSVRIAHRGAFSFANDWAWLYGVPIATWIAGAVAASRNPAAMTTGYPVLDGLFAAAGAFVVTYLVRFLYRFPAAPFRLYSHERRRRYELEEQFRASSEKPLRFKWDAMDLNTGDMTADGAVMVVHVENVSAQTIDDVQVKITSYADARWDRKSPLGYRLVTIEKESAVTIHPGEIKAFQLVRVSLFDPFEKAHKQMVIAPDAPRELTHPEVSHTFNVTALGRNVTSPDEATYEVVFYPGGWRFGPKHQRITSSEKVAG